MAACSRHPRPRPVMHLRAIGKEGLTHQAYGLTRRSWRSIAGCGRPIRRDRGLPRSPLRHRDVSPPTPNQMVLGGVCNIHRRRKAAPDGNNMCIVDDKGITELLRGGQTVCLRSRQVTVDEVEMSSPATRPLQTPSESRFVALTIASALRHETTELELDLTGNGPWNGCPRTTYDRSLST